MDNSINNPINAAEEIKITNLEPETSGRYPWGVNADSKPIVSQVVPVVAGAGVGLIAGFLLCKFVAKPIINAIKAKREAKVVQAAPAASTEEPKKEE